MTSEFGKIKVKQKSGNESLTFKKHEIGLKLIDFWQWSVSDIISNATRGRFAEFIVASALSIDLKIVRDEWSAYDLKSPEGIKIEVKSAAYLQSWYQRELSKISFSIKATRNWESLTNKYAKTPSRQSDVYVFCVFKHRNQKTLNPLNLEQWEFYVVSTPAIDKYDRSDSSITLRSLQKLTIAVEYDDLRLAIIEKYEHP